MKATTKPAVLLILVTLLTLKVLPAAILYALPLLLAGMWAVFLLALAFFRTAIVLREEVQNG